MKRFIILLFSILAICGCTPEEEPVGSIELSAGQKELIEINPEGGSPYLRFSSLLDWTIEVAGDGSWIHLDQTEGPAGSARVRLDAGRNETSSKRSVVLNICSFGVTVPVTVEQDVYETTFEVLDAEKEVSAAGGTFYVKVKADVEYTIETDAEWIHERGSKAPFTYEHCFDFDPNPQPQIRSAEIRFIAGSVTKVFNVTQRPAGTEQDDWKYESFKQRSLAMRFTADWCGYCPGMAKAFETAKTSMGGKLLLLSVHAGGSALDFDSADPLLSRFHISGFPTGIIDARASIPNYSQSSYTTEAAKLVAEETWNAYPSKTGIAFTSTLVGSELSVDVDVYVKEADDYLVTVLLLEDKIVGYQSGGGSNYVHNDIARLAITSATGDEVNVEQDGTIWHGTYTATVPSVCNPENLRILVYVEKPYGSQTIVKGVETAEYGRFGDTYVDNCRAAAVGTEAALELI